ncbi:hypothetical protein [Thermosulfurimonas sp. F29]|uniref:hypothetical protein n=1 Tax=Thermosulfurimonas sp. F29 TaxID=2867247 RepID=UPI001C833556|nr:hypothetical protein [Thermosulfurimonas sp. F29]MBX6424137.1 hypothetical protein [Thermosulfurimonas sp. F29]
MQIGNRISGETPYWQKRGEHLLRALSPLVEYFGWGCFREEPQRYLHLEFLIALGQLAEGGAIPRDRAGYLIEYLDDLCGEFAWRKHVPGLNESEQFERIKRMHLRVAEEAVRLLSARRNP